MNRECGGQPCSQDKGKPSVKAGRKATDPMGGASPRSLCWVAELPREFLRV